MHVFELWEETGVPRVNQRRHGEDMQTQHRKDPGRFTLGLNPGHCCEAAVLSTVLPDSGKEKLLNVIRKKPSEDQDSKRDLKCSFLDLIHHRAACVSVHKAMEPWPVLAWVLMLTFIADWLKTAQSRDFTEKDIIFLHPSTTPYPGGFKCFTCEEASDNYECNRWAPDLYCPQETKYCYTSHTQDWVGKTVSVTKRCAALKDCLDTGCTNIDNEVYRVCVACCEGNICNMPLPRNESDAIFVTTSPLSGSYRAVLHHTLLLFFFIPLIIVTHD